MENALVPVQQYDDMQVSQVIAKLEPYLSFTQNNNRTFKSGVGLQISDNFDNVSLKRTSLYDSDIADSSFVNSALTGSYFSDTKFRFVTFEEANLQYCHFIHNIFDNVKILSTNLSYSSFYNSTFSNTLFKGSTVSELLFDECVFENCTFTSSMLENAIFSHCTLLNVQFIDTNTEYMELKSSHTQSVTIPFAQFPYIYGAYTHMRDGGIQIQGNGSILTAEEYQELQDALIVYYTSIEEYFPLTNLYLSRGDSEQAYRCIASGLQSSVVSKNFRMLKFFCKLAVQGALFEYQKLRELYALIDSWVRQQNLNIYEQRDFVHNSAEIRSLLLDSIYDSPTAQIALQTNINSGEPEKVIRFIEYVDDTIRALCTEQISHIEYRHNSDANFIAVLSAHYSEIILVLAALMSFATNVETRILNAQQIKLNQLKIRKESAELEKVEAAKQKGEQLQQDNVRYEIRYYISNTSAEDAENDALYL